MSNWNGDLHRYIIVTKLMLDCHRARWGTSGMQITVTELDAATRRVTLVGRLDILAAEAIGLPLAAAAGARGNMIVDMAGVDFIASLGIRQLVTTAKTVARGAGRLVLLRPNPVVAEVLSASGLDQLLPIVQSEDEARAAFAGATGA